MKSHQTNITVQNIMYLDKLRNGREMRGRKECTLGVEIRRSPNPVVARRIGVLRCCSGVVATASTNPREPTSNHPLTVPEPSQGAPRLRTIDSHGNEGESRVARSKGKGWRGWGVQGGPGTAMRPLRPVGVLQGQWHTGPDTLPPLLFFLYLPV